MNKNFESEGQDTYSKIIWNISGGLCSQVLYLWTTEQFGTIWNNILKKLRKI